MDRELSTAFLAALHTGVGTVSEAILAQVDALTDRAHAAVDGLNQYLPVEETTKEDPDAEHHVSREDMVDDITRYMNNYADPHNVTKSSYYENMSDDVIEARWNNLPWWAKNQP